MAERPASWRDCRCGCSGDVERRTDSGSGQALTGHVLQVFPFLSSVTFTKTASCGRRVNVAHASGAARERVNSGIVDDETRTHLRSNRKQRSMPRNGNLSSTRDGRKTSRKCSTLKQGLTGVSIEKKKFRLHVCSVCFPHTGYRDERARAPCRRRIGRVVPRADNFGVQSWCNTWPPKWIQSVSVQNKNFSGNTKELAKVLGANQEKPKVIYTDNSLEFGKACEDLSWNHCTSIPQIGNKWDC